MNSLREQNKTFSETYEGSNFSCFIAFMFEELSFIPIERI